MSAAQNKVGLEFDILDYHHPRVTAWALERYERLVKEAKSAEERAVAIHAKDAGRAQELSREGHELSRLAEDYRQSPGGPPCRRSREGLLLQLAEMVCEGWEVFGFATKSSPLDPYQVLLRRVVK